MTWATTRVPHARRQGQVSPATSNQRLAILSSFYTYRQQQGRLAHLDLANPIKGIKRRKVQAYASALPLDGDETAKQLSGIETTTPMGKRDYALLLVALTTGRRASELISLRLHHLKPWGKHLLLTFEHCKGGRVMRDALDDEVSAALMEYLHAVYGSDLGGLPPETPIWVSFSRQNRGQAITEHTLRNVCQKHLLTSNIHALRHTFAVELEKLGAPISEVAARLGHTDENMTSAYLKQIRAAYNPYASRLAARFGAGKYEQE